MSRVSRGVARLCVFAFLICAAAGAEERVDNPKYQAWSSFKPGAFVTARTETHLGDKVMVAELTQKLIEVMPEKLTLESTMKYEQTVTSDKKEITAKVPQAKAIAEDDLPEGVKGDLKSLPDEDVIVAGRTYKCKVVAFTGKDSAGPVSGKIWTSAGVPGCLVKSEMNSEVPVKIRNSTIITAIEAPVEKP